MRILIISHNSFSHTYNNGKTLLSMFNGWPKDELAQLFFTPNETPPYSFCHRYFSITDLDVLRYLTCASKNCGHELSKNDEEISFSETSKTWLSKIKKNGDQLALFRDLMWETNVWKTKHLKEWITRFSPQLIFYVGGGNKFSHDVALWASKYYNIPLCVFFTDDYVLNPVKNTLLDYLQGWRKKRFYKKSIDRAVKCFAIGDMMANIYTEFYNKKFSPIANSVDIKPYKQLQTTSNKIIISYFGGLHLSRWKTITLLGKIIHQVSLSCNINITFNVYSTSTMEKYILDEFATANICFCGRVEGKQLEDAMTNSDILVHVESFDKKYRTLTKYSVSTKIPEYLSTGRCVLGYGPHEVASIRLLDDNHIAVCITDNDNEKEIFEKIKKILTNKVLRTEIGYKGYQYASQKFDAKITRKHFFAELEDAVKSKQIINKICSPTKPF